MNASFFTFLMAVLSSTAFMLIVHLLRNNRAFLKGFGVPTVLVLYGLCLFRMVFPIEFPFTVPVRFEAVYNRFYQAVTQSEWPVGGSELSILEIAGLVWIVGVIVCLISSMVSYLVSMFRLLRFENYRNPVADKVFKTVQQELGRQYPVRVFIYPGTPTPMFVGFFWKCIPLVSGNYTETEMHHILTHEYTHCLNRDVYINLLVKIFQCIFWWNPLVYLLQSDVQDILDVKCDLIATQNYTEAKKRSYLSTLMAVYEKAKEKEEEDGKRKKFPLAMQFFGHSTSNIVERFDIILHPPKKPVVAAVQVAFCSLCVLLTLATYTFVLQPYYEPPTDDIQPNQTIYEATQSNSFIFQNSDGSYSIITDQGDNIPIDDEDLDFFLDLGYIVKEE